MSEENLSEEGRDVTAKVNEEELVETDGNEAGGTVLPFPFPVTGFVCPTATFCPRLP